MLAAFERFMNEGTYTNNSLHTFILHTKPFIFDGNGALSLNESSRSIAVMYGIGVEKHLEMEVIKWTNLYDSTCCYSYKCAKLASRAS